MANIMVTQRCNLRCPYCFASEFVGKADADITWENFQAALNFALSSGDASVGLIGGEPAMHGDFDRLLDRIIREGRVEECTVYTNGLMLDRFARKLLHPKFRLLINCNSPADTGEAAYERLRRNLRLLCGEYYMTDRITLGANLYTPDFDGAYLLELVKEFGFSYVRASVSVPDGAGNGGETSLQYFLRMKPAMLAFFQSLMKAGAMPFYDCNAMPRCVFTPLEIKNLRRLAEDTGLEDDNLFSDTAVCGPVIDILPDLTVIRCFALSEYRKAKVSFFSELSEAKAYFHNCFDTLAYRVCSDPKCGQCFDRATMKCSGGCYAFKAPRMIQCDTLFATCEV